MSKQEVKAVRYIENFIPENIIEKSVHQVCNSVADAFLGQIEYGKDYVVRTYLEREDWADGFGSKYTYRIKSDEIVRCRDCYFAEEIEGGYWCDRFDNGKEHVTSGGFCAWGERNADE